MASTNEILAAYDSQLRRLVPSVPPAGHQFHLDGPLLRVTGQQRGFVETLQDLGMEGAAVDRLIREQRDYFAARGESMEWKTRSHDLPADLPARLMAAGFLPEDRETVLVGETAAIAANPVLPQGVQLRQVHERQDLARIAAMKSEVWGADYSWVEEDLRSRLASDPENLTVFAAEAGEELVSAAWAEFNQGTDFAGLWGGSTLAAWRGQGIYKALVSARAQAAAARGVKYLQVDASVDSEPILRRLGFREITTTTPYVWSQGGQVRTNAPTPATPD
jgi:GNAT superfamily N-acetyltransferase